MRCSSPTPWTLYVPVSVAASVETVVLRQTMPKGTQLSEAHLQLQLQPAHSLRGGYISSLEGATGKLLRRDQQAGKPLYVNMLLTPNTVERGQATLLLAAIDNIEVKMSGTALAGGATGERIRVRNNSSGKTVEGVITAEGNVRIQ